jgi:hypothetical protein
LFTSSAQVLRGFTSKEALDATHAPCHAATLYRRVKDEREKIVDAARHDDATLCDRVIAVSRKTVASPLTEGSTLTPPLRKKKRHSGPIECYELVEGGGGGSSGASGASFAASSSAAASTQSAAEHSHRRSKRNQDSKKIAGGGSISSKSTKSKKKGMLCGPHQFGPWYGHEYL